MDALKASWAISHITERKTNILDIYPVSIFRANSDVDRANLQNVGF
jgi:hypothetical protein